MSTLNRGPEWAWGVKRKAALRLKGLQRAEFHCETEDAREVRVQGWLLQGSCLQAENPRGEGLGDSERREVVLHGHSQTPRAVASIGVQASSGASVLEVYESGVSHGRNEAADPRDFRDCQSVQQIEVYA
jgi:hypothetical protein